jgi:ABC-type transport system substrate-binding protein
MTDKITVPIKPTPYDDGGLHLDTDDPDYLFGDAALYLTLALSYDSLAGPEQIRDSAGVASPDYTRMRSRLATSWQEIENKAWTLTLRKARSQAGNELCSDDIVWRFAKSYAHKTLGSWRWRESVGMETCTALSESQIRFDLRANFEFFPNWLLSNTPNVIDAREVRSHTTADDPWGFAWLNEHVAGFGAYDLDGVDPGVMTFVPRSDYWMGPVSTGPVELARVQTRREGLAFLESGEPVMLIGPDPDELAALLRRPDLVIERVYGGHASVEIDFSSEPFDDVRVRHALALAVPYSDIIQKGLLGLARPWRSPVKGNSQWYEPSYWHYDTNIERARQLLRDAGHSSGISSTLYIPSRPDCVRMAEILRDAWHQIGVEVEILPLTAAEPGWMPPLHLRTECAHNLSEPIYDIAHDYAVIDPILPAPGGPKGAGRWHPLWEKNESVLELYRDMLMENEPEKKQALFMAMQKYIVEFSSSIFLAENIHALVFTKSVPPEFYAPNSRVYQALQYQNPTSNYLPQTRD